MKGGSLFRLAVWSMLGIALLCGLGVWQLVRLGEKRQYLAHLEERMQAQPMPLAQILARAEAGEDIEFLKAEASGSYAGGDLYKQTTFDAGPGWEVLTPFRTSDGIVVLVDRGAIPSDMRGPASQAPAGALTLQGVVRLRNRGQGFFDPENDPDAATWYWWDVPAMLGSLKIEADAKVAPFVLQALPQPGAPRYPVVENLETGIPNNHLQYALTWFALAICLAVVAGLLARRQLRDALEDGPRAD